MAKPTTVEQYVALFPPEVQQVLASLRAVVQEAAPEATQTISYDIIAFKVGGKPVVYFGAWKKHIGFYPITGAVREAFAQELSAFKQGRGTVQFPLSKPMPLDLVRRLTASLYGEVQQSTRR